jgi:DNA-binding SARP family transcriptional activator
MDFRLLGPLEVVEHGRSLSLGGAKQRALLTMLLLHANEVVATERLIDDLWGEAPPATVAKSVHVYVSRLRGELGEDRILTRRPGYVLRADPGEIDLARFEALLADAAAADPAQAAQVLRDALALWRGPALADLAYEPFAQGTIARLEELRLTALERRIDADLATGRHADVVGELDMLAAEHPLREGVHGRRMVALYRCGRQAEALEAYQAARRALVEELGVEPGRALRELQQAVLAQDPSLDLTPASAQSGGGVFVGRERELAELLACLDDTLAGRARLALVAGEPGIGKSRLLEELGARARSRGADVILGRCWEAGGAPAYWP